ncbi:MAG: hypothetical protein ACM3OB_04985 [Acidobacteriota bacterium]
MTAREATQVYVQEKKLVCPICSGDRFWSRKSLLATRKFAFFELEWVNRAAINQICERCGHILWFLESKT